MPAQPPSLSAGRAYGAAAAALLAPAAAPAAAVPSGPSSEDTLQQQERLAAMTVCLREQAAEAAREMERQAARQAALRQELEERCKEAERQHEGVAAALHALADRLACLSAVGTNDAPVLQQQQQQGRPLHPHAAPLLSLDLPDSYASACTTLLDNLSGYLQHNFPHTAGGGSGTLAAAQQHQAAALELEQLQSCWVKAERLRVEEEAELARLKAELEVLRQPSTTPTAASLGYSTADLQAEVASLQRRRAASLAAAVEAAEAAAAATAGADAVEEQAALQRASVEQRVHAKKQVAGILARHLARQLLAQRLLQHEQAVVQEVQATVAAARQDAELALQAVQTRLPGYAKAREQQQHQHQQQAGQPPAQPQQLAAPIACRALAEPHVSAYAAQQQGVQEGEPQAGRQQQPSDPLATAQQLLACRAQLLQLSEQLRGEVLPAHQAVFARLHGLLYGSTSSSDGGGSAGSAGAAPSRGSSSGGGGGSATVGEEAVLQLTPPDLQEQLAAVAAAEQALSLQANALLEEVITRQQAPAERQLAERVLQEFWSERGPERLAQLADKQRRQLATFAAS